MSEINATINGTDYQKGEITTSDVSPYAQYTGQQYKSLESIFVGDCEDGMVKGYSGSLTGQACLAEFNSALDFNFQDAGALELNAPMQYGYYLGGGPEYLCEEKECKVTITVSPVLLYFVHEYLTKSWNFSVENDILVSPTAPNAAYDENGAEISESESYPASSHTRSYNVQNFGDPGSYNPQNLPQGLASLSPSTPIGKAGAWFEAVNSRSEPLTQVTIALEQDSLEYENNGQNGDFLSPNTWDPQDPDAGGGNSYAGWGLSGGTAEYNSFTLQCVKDDPGYFLLSGLPAGTYTIAILGGNEGGYGSYYTAPSFTMTLASYSSPEAISASQSQDPDGFVNPKEDEVVVGAPNPSTQVVAGGKVVNSSSPLTSSIGAAFTSSYQLQSYLPFPHNSSPLSLVIQFPKGMTMDTDIKDMRIDGLPADSVIGASGSYAFNSSANSVSIVLSAEGIKKIAAQGKDPAPNAQIALQDGQDFFHGV